MQHGNKTTEKTAYELQTQGSQPRRHETATGQKEEMRRSREKVRKQQRRKARRD